MAWFFGQSLLFVALAFLLGLLVGWLIWGRTTRATTDKPSEVVDRPEPVVAVVAEPAVEPEKPTEAEAAVETEPVVEAEPVEAVPVAEAEPEVEAVVEAEPVVEPVPVAEAEPVVEAEPEVVAEAEPVAAPEPEPVVDAEPVATEPVAAPEPIVAEPVAVAEPVVAEPVAVAEPEPVVVPGPVAPADSVPESVVAPDKLQRIEGVGPKISTALITAGIRTFEQLAATDETTLTAALRQAGLRFAPSLPTWSVQAALLAKGDEAGFTALTRELVAGRRTR